MSFAHQIAWLASYDRKTGALSTHAAKDCGYGDLLKAGYVIDVGPDGAPDLFITDVGKNVGPSIASRSGERVRSFRPFSLKP